MMSLLHPRDLDAEIADRADRLETARSIAVST